MKTLSKILLILILIPIIYALGSIIVTAFTGQIDDSDLLYHPRVIDDSENAYVILMPVLKEIKEQKPGKDIESLLNNKKAFDHSKANYILNQYSSYLTVLSEALELNYFQVPMKRSLHEANKEKYTIQIMFLYKLEFLYIKSLLNKGNVVEASKEILKLLKYGYLLQNSDGGLIYFAIGTIAKKRAFELVQELVTNKVVDNTYYKRLINQIEKYGDNRGIINGLKIEYTITANTLKSFVEQSTKNDPEHKEKFELSWLMRLKMNFFYNENATIKEVAEIFRQELKNINGPYANIEHKKKKFPSNRILYYLNILSGNPIGKILLALVTPSYGSLVEQKFKIDARSNLAKLLLAIKVYHIDTDILPNSLEELMPTYISAIPKDPFDNKDLRYSKTEKIIYSVYLNMKDDKGDEKKDLCIKLSFP